MHIKQVAIYISQKIWYLLGGGDFNGDGDLDLESANRFGDGDLEFGADGPGGGGDLSTDGDRGFDLIIIIAVISARIITVSYVYLSGDKDLERDGDDLDGDLLDSTVA